MSGIEIAGVLLGAFPLIVSALEHYEKTKKGVRGWWLIKTEVKKDLGRVRDCQLRYILNLQALLAPLESDGLITATDSERLLANFDDAGWKSSDIQEALIERLGETKSRFFENLKAMDEAIVKLAKVTMVEDLKFQATLQAETTTRDAALKRNANDHLRYEMKRIVYTVSRQKRVDALDEIEHYNGVLAEFLRARDGIAQHQTTTETSSTRRTKRQFKHILAFWKQADNLYQLMQDSWRCQCAPWHCAYLWLDRRTKTSDDIFKILLRFSDDRLGQHSCAPETWQKQGLRVQKRSDHPVTAPALPLPSGPSTAKVAFTLPSRTYPSPVTVGSTASSSPGQALTGSRTGTVTASPASSLLPQMATLGLCDTAQKIRKYTSDSSLGDLGDMQSGHCFSVFSTCDSIAASESFASILEPGSPHVLYRTQRLTLAYTIASSFLQLYETPWLLNSALSLTIHLPVSPDTTTLLHDQPFLHAKFNKHSNEWSDDDALVELGILLLELCFNKPLDSHPKWRDPSLAALIHNRLIRKAVASEWSKSVQLEFDNDYFTAVDWCLHRATLSSAEWRLGFARSVVQPLRVCFELAVARMQPTP